MDPVVLYVIALLLLVHRFMCTKRKPAAFLIAALAAGASLAFFEDADILLMLLWILIFNGVITTYGSRENYAFLLLAVIFTVPAFYLITFISQAMLLGLLSGAYLFFGRVERTNTHVERRRDAVQVLLGLALIALFTFIPSAYVRLFLVAAILAGVLLGNFSVRNKKSEISKGLHSFERKGAILGQGALWLAVGTLVAISFLGKAEVMAVLIAIFLSDAIATMMGTAYKRPRLPYNKRKSITGTLGYFATTAIVAFPFIGYASLLIALIGALVESSPWQVDDNLDTAVVLTAVLLILGALHLI